ncbi:MAG TPA: hypothetical protein VN622_17950 [Clostridia bacterium]|nr:hypothetical protein [Clostridia bacterium]
MRSASLRGSAGPELQLLLTFQADRYMYLFNDREIRHYRTPANELCAAGAG